MNNAKSADDNRSSDIERSTFKHGGEPWKDPAVLEELYHERNFSQKDIAERFNTSQQNISNWMNRFDIDTRPAMHKRGGRGIYRCQRDDFRSQFFIDNNGGDGEDEIVRFYENNLVALESNPLSDVIRDDTDIHHGINSPLHVNLSDNLKVLPEGLHRACHDELVSSPEYFLENIGEPVELDGSDITTVYISEEAMNDLPDGN